VMKQELGRNCDFTMKKVWEKIWIRCGENLLEKLFKESLKKIAHWQDHHFTQDGILDDVEESECK
jgi:hypothetical protein